MASPVSPLLLLTMVQSNWPVVGFPRLQHVVSRWWMGTVCECCLLPLSFGMSHELTDTLWHLTVHWHNHTESSEKMTTFLLWHSNMSQLTHLYRDEEMLTEAFVVYKKMRALIYKLMQSISRGTNAELLDHTYVVLTTAGFKQKIFSWNFRYRLIKSEKDFFLICTVYFYTLCPISVDAWSLNLVKFVWRVFSHKFCEKFEALQSCSQTGTKLHFTYTQAHIQSLYAQVRQSISTITTSLKSAEFIHGFGPCFLCSDTCCVYLVYITSIVVNA